MEEELTTEMHSEFEVSKETDLKHTVFACLSSIKMGVKREIALKEFRVTEYDIAKFQDEYDNLN